MRLWSKKSPWDQQNLMNGISLHYYTISNSWDDKGSATVFTEKDWMSTLSKTLRIDELINKHLAIMDKYDPAHKVGLSVDEWGNWFNVEPGTNPGFLYQQNTLRDAMVAGINLNIFNNHADRIVMANIAQVINVLQSVILTQKEKIVFTPTYYVFKMYKVHQGATMIPLTVACRDYTFEGKSVPSISVSASKDKEGRTHITLVNLDPNAANSVTLNLGLTQNINVSGEVITSKNMNDYNDFGVTAKVVPAKFDGFKLNGNQLLVNMPAKSVVGLELVLK
jgi:alpha-N-arabinofuranosidase